MHLKRQGNTQGPHTGVGVGVQLEGKQKAKLKNMGWFIGFRV